jgi:GGDEF domain-containing protein
LGAPYAIDGREVRLTASIGLLVIGPGARPARYAEGLRETDRAMYAAKAAGGNRVTEAGTRPA